MSWNRRFLRTFTRHIFWTPDTVHYDCYCEDHLLTISAAANLAQQGDSATQNLAATFVNAFVNTGFCADKLMTEDGSKWVYKNKNEGKIAATASLGLIQLWNIDGGIPLLNKYVYSNDEHIKAGMLMLKECQ